jgi:hypothetical protein
MNNQSRLPWTFLFAGQYQNLLLLACLIPGAVFIAGPSLYEQTGLGKPAYFWFYAGIGTAIVHQFVVWFVWRTRLIFSIFSRVFGQFLPQTPVGKGRCFQVFFQCYVFLCISHLMGNRTFYRFTSGTCGLAGALFQHAYI